MTREEAKKEIEKVFEPAFANYIVEALTKGVTVSEKESTTKHNLGVDCISRAYLLDDSKYHTVFNDDTGNFEDVVYREDIEKAPSITPIRPKGHWIPRNSFLLQYKCSECGRESEKYNFCPNCGADMREVET